MREIKFRAWDERDKEMQMLPRLHRKPDGTLWASNDSDSTIVPLMQFTGLLDREGKEIYEGDIMLHDSTGEKFVVRFNEGAFYPENPRLWGFSLPNVNNSAVIGNIYQNSDLIPK